MVRRIQSRAGKRFAKRDFVCEEIEIAQKRPSLKLGQSNLAIQLTNSLQEVKCLGDIVSMDVSITLGHIFLGEEFGDITSLIHLPPINVDDVLAPSNLNSAVRSDHFKSG